MTLLRAWSRRRGAAPTTLAHWPRRRPFERSKAPSQDASLRQARTSRWSISATVPGATPRHCRQCRRTIRPQRAAGDTVVRRPRVGFAEQKKSVLVNPGASVTLDFTLEQAVVKLQEVVTTATGEQRKVELEHCRRDRGIETRRGDADHQHERPGPPLPRLSRRCRRRCSLYRTRTLGEPHAFRTWTSRGRARRARSRTAYARIRRGASYVVVRTAGRPPLVGLRARDVVGRRWRFRFASVKVDHEGRELGRVPIPVPRARRKRR